MIYFRTPCTMCLFLCRLDYSYITTVSSNVVIIVSATISLHNTRVNTRGELMPLSQHVSML